MRSIRACGGAVLLVGYAAGARGACDCATPPCTGTSIVQRSPALSDNSANPVPPAPTWCDTCDSAGVSTFSMTFSCAGGACTCGRYETGDYWILDPAPTDAVNGVLVSSVKPKAANGRNGLEINPSDGVGPYDARTNPFQYDAAQNAAVPFTAQAGQSLVKAISLEPDHKDCAFGMFCGSNAICIHSYFVVTIVGQVPPADAYRPPYFGQTKPTTTWRDSQIDWTLVPGFAVAGLPDAPTLLQAWDSIRAPQVDHWPSTGGFHQQQLALVGTGNYGSTYGADLAISRSRALCRALGAEPIGSGTPSRRDILRGFVQQGIDTYWIMQTVGLDSPPLVRWLVSGGHGGGRKAGLVVAATLLRDPAMRSLIAASVADEIATGDHFFTEDGIAYYSPRAGRALFGEMCPTHAPGTPASNALDWWNPNDPSDLCRDPDGLIDGGNHLQGSPPGYAYAFTAAASGAGIFGALFPQVRVVWAHDPFFGLADRWFGYETIPGDTGAPGGVWMDDACQNTTPASFNPYSGCVPGTGRMCGSATCESFHGASGRGQWAYTSGFCEQLWANFRICADNPAAPGCSGYRGLFCGDSVCAGGETVASCPVDCLGP